MTCWPPGRCCARAARLSTPAPWPLPATTNGPAPCGRSKWACTNWSCKPGRTVTPPGPSGRRQTGGAPRRAQRDSRSGGPLVRMVGPRRGGACRRPCRPGPGRATRRKPRRCRSHKPCPVRAGGRGPGRREVCHRPDHRSPRAPLGRPPRAAFGAWYELFPRSFGGLRGAAGQVPRLAELGFDVLYLPPVHPIGHTFRKGKDNSLTAGPGDPGSPWAIGSEEGGHTALHPDLGTFDDFDFLVRTAADHGMEVALDYALNCTPDHPWVKEHPEWFHHRPDGSIAYAENPPKKYQDIYPTQLLAPREADRVACGKRARGSSTSGPTGASGSSGWTTRTPSRSPSGNG